MDTTYMTRAEIEAMQPIFRSCPCCEREGFVVSDIVEYKGKEMCDECYIVAKQEEIGHLQLVVDRSEFGGWQCLDKEYDGAPDSGCVIGRGNTIQEAIDEYLEFAISIKHDIDPKHIPYTWSGETPFVLYLRNNLQ